MSLNEFSDESKIACWYNKRNSMLRFSFFSKFSNWKLELTALSSKFVFMAMMILFMVTSAVFLTFMLECWKKTIRWGIIDWPLSKSRKICEFDLTESRSERRLIIFEHDVAKSSSLFVSTWISICIKSLILFWNKYRKNKMNRYVRNSH